MIPATSFAMVQTAERVLEPRDLPIPAIDDESAILEVEACGICGSDYEQWKGDLPAPLPAVPGHEPVGRIAAIGDGAAGRWGVDVGDRVAVETLLACQRCDTCRSGQYQRCPELRVYSLISTDAPPGLWGAYAQYMYLAPQTLVHKLSPSIAPQIAVMFNPLGAGYRWAVEVPALEPGLDAIELVRRGGTIVLAGVKGARPVPGFLSDRIIAKEATIKGASGMTSSGYRSAIAMIESGSVALEAMHTHDFRLEEAELAIRTLAREVPGDESIHSCLLPEH